MQGNPTLCQCPQCKKADTIITDRGLAFPHKTQLSFAVLSYFIENHLKDCINADVPLFSALKSKIQCPYCGTTRMLAEFFDANCQNFQELWARYIHQRRVSHCRVILNSITSPDNSHTINELEQIRAKPRNQRTVEDWQKLAGYEPPKM